jgi:hypothetical protein
MSIPLWPGAKTGVQISTLALGGHHLGGGARDEKPSSKLATGPSMAASPPTTMPGNTIAAKQSPGWALGLTGTA